MTSKGDKMAQKLNCNESQALIDIFIILDMFYSQAGL